MVHAGLQKEVSSHFSNTYVYLPNINGLIENENRRSTINLSCMLEWVTVSLSDFFCKTSPRNADGFGTAINSGRSRVGKTIMHKRRRPTG